MLSHRISIEVQEWAVADMPDSLSDLDYLSLSRLSEQGRIHLLPGKLRNTYRIRALSWVGSLRLEGFDLVIRPKVSVECVYAMLNWAHGSSVSIPLGGLYGEVQSLPDLLARVFSEKLSKLLKQELHKNYLRVQGQSPVLRGKLLVQEDLKKNWPIRKGVSCEFSNRSDETPVNRVIAWVRDQLLRSSWLKDLETKERLRESLSFLAEVPPRMDRGYELKMAQGIRVSGLYQEVFELSVLFLKGLSLDFGKDHFTQGLLLDMNRVFEDYIRLVLSQRMEGAEFQVSEKGKVRAFLCRDHNGQGMYEEVPDLGVLKRGRLVHLMDAKYKDYDNLNIEKEDVRQLSLYLVSFRKFGIKRADLVYPGVQSRYPLQLPEEKEIGFYPIDLSGSWVDLKKKSDAWATQVMNRIGVF